MTQEKKTALFELLVKREPVEVTIGGLSFKALLASLDSTDCTGETVEATVLLFGDDSDKERAR